MRMHGIDRIAHQVAEHLSNLTFETTHGWQRTFALLDANAGVHDAALKNRNNTIDELLPGDLLRAGRLLVEAKGLVGDAETRRNSRSAYVRTP